MSAASTGDEAIDMTDVDALYKMAEVSRVLRSATSTIEKFVHLASGTNDLTLMHCLVLVHLSRKASCKQLDLKSATGIAPTHLTKLVDELTHRGFVRRHRSSWDRRQIILALTAPGRETALRLLTSLHELTHKTQLNAIEELGSSLKRFVSTTANDEWLDRGSAHTNEVDQLDRGDMIVKPIN
ncbi:hypothetical protein GCM10007901_00180 [Dyella acidisoli]|uniref:HTH marR-type domain-containing protein n=2 Tax=Dyella acidisoli TaxID=1867834 RepID=A0ABQ5XHD1_9GAMM|nr:hypothetical protein GCM10007901_00180 [Dyella acidisoli]